MIGESMLKFLYIYIDFLYKKLRRQNWYSSPFDAEASRLEPLPQTGGGKSTLGAKPFKLIKKAPPKGKNFLIKLNFLLV